MRITGTTGRDTLRGTADDDELIGESGSDFMLGGAGNDTYFFSLLDGRDTIQDSQGSDTLRFDATVDKDTVHFIRGAAFPNDLAISYGQSQDFIQIVGFYRDPAFQIEKVVFADGSSVDLTQALTFTGGDANDQLLGTDQFDDRMNGRRGTDVLNAGAGNDVYLFKQTDGNDTISDPSGNDRIQFDQSVGIDTVRFERRSATADDLVIHYGTVGDRITVRDHFVNLGVRVERIEFADGQSIDLTAPLLFAGTDERDSLFGSDFDDVLNGGGGNDLLQGLNGNDVYVFDGKFGDDTVQDLAGTDALRFSGLRFGELAFAVADRDANDLVITAPDGSTVLLDQQLFPADQKIERLEFGNGGLAVWNEALGAFIRQPGSAETGTAGADVVARTDQDDFFSGLGGNDIVFGRDGDDELEGGAGDDLLVGGAGDDFLSGGPGGDKLDGGDGLDVAAGGDGDDILRGGNGDDRLEGGDGIDILFGGAGNDTILGGAGDDRQLVGGIGDDLIEGNAGNDLIDGGSGADVLNGGVGDDVLVGGTGDDSLRGLAGDDILTGGFGADLLDGGDGLDRFLGGRGDDRILGGAGDDTAVYNGPASRYEWKEIRFDTWQVTDKLATGGLGTDTLTDVEFLEFASGTVRITF